MDIKIAKLIAERLLKSSPDSSFLRFAKLSALIGIALGVFALLLSLSILNGYETALKRGVESFYSHARIERGDRKLIQADSNKLDILKSAFHEIKKINSVVEREALIRGASNIDGAVARAKSDESYLHDLKIEGAKNFANSDENSAIIGSRLAKNIGASIGDYVSISVMTPSPNGKDFYPKTDKFKIIGVFSSQMAEFDQSFIFIPYKKAEYFLDCPANYANSLEVYFDNLDVSIASTPRIAQFLGDKYFAYSAYDAMASAFSWIEIQKKPIPIVLGLIALVAAMNIATALLIAGMEKTKTIGILSALGLKRSDILIAFSFQGFLLGGVGALLGGLLALVFSLLQINYHIISLNGELYYLDYLPITINWVHYIVVISSSLMLSFLATLVPGRIASKISPIKAIRFK